ncbi:RNA-directed DNA polymerase [Pseudanabaena sp. PCC 6802]|uniref:RNA-directed DNA polymerase n=1 Tax=Pseudanabaena sp. PCC 6802 TaxID=118173 RepID=UPI00034D07E0|nr:RNA-directed DNA polymerase [Pseudanabaena sp. PCC 6802]
MKRHGNLWAEIVSFANLLDAANKARKRKRYRDNVLDFHYNLELELVTLQKELVAKTYRPGEYRTFQIFVPRPRFVSAAPYRDRVVHHALCNVVAPILDRALIDDTYANRTGKGTHRALRRLTKFARSSRYVLQCDIKKYFPSIDRNILKELLQNKIKCADTLWLIEAIIDASNPQETVLDYFPGDDLLAPSLHPKGLPIGNLTSQLFANFYLSGCDRFIKEALSCRKYVRYVDDFALFADDCEYLVDARHQIEDFLCTLRLKLHPVKTQIFETHIGVSFLGFCTLSDRIRVRSDNLQRGRRRQRKMKKGMARGVISIEQMQRSQQSWRSHLAHGDTWRLCQKLFAPHNGDPDSQSGTIATELYPNHDN